MGCKTKDEQYGFHPKEKMKSRHEAVHAYLSYDRHDVDSVAASKENLSAADDRPPNLSALDSGLCSWSRARDTIVVLISFVVTGPI